MPFTSVISQRGAMPIVANMTVTAPERTPARIGKRIRPRRRGGKNARHGDPHPRECCGYVHGLRQHRIDPRTVRPRLYSTDVESGVRVRSQ